MYYNKIMRRLKLAPEECLMVGKARPFPEDKTDTTPLYTALSGENKHLLQTFRWVESKTGFVPHENRGAKYYPLV